MNIFQLIILWIGAIAVAFVAFKRADTISIIVSGLLIVVAAVMTFISLRREKAGDTGQQPAQPDIGPEQNAGSYPYAIVPRVFSKPLLIFKRDSVEYRGKFLNYSRIKGIYYNTVKVSINLIPVSQTYTYCIEADDAKISIHFASFFYLGNKKLQEAYLKMIELTKIYVEPIIIAKIIKEVFDNNKTVKIGSVEITKNGYSKKKLFGGREEVLWTDKVFIPQYYAGRVYMYKVKNDKPKVFASVSMRTLNSVILPELVQVCYNKTHPKTEV